MAKNYEWIAGNGVILQGIKSHSYEHKSNS